MSEKEFFNALNEKNREKYHEELNDYVEKIVLDHGGEKKAVGLLLMSIGNMATHFADLCKKHKDKEIWMGLMRDPAVNLSLKYSAGLWDLREKYNIEFQEK